MTAWPLSASARWWPTIAAVLTIVGAVYCGAVLLELAPFGRCSGQPLMMCDGAAYYFADREAPYDWSQLGPGVQRYRYAPAFLWVIAPLRLLPWEAFAVVWFALHVGAFVWLKAGWMMAIPGLNEDVIRGNISVFLAVAVVLALTRNPGWWSGILLTKVTPGVGIVWHAVRREWRALGWATGVTLLIVTVGALIDQNLWLDWLEALLRGPHTYETGHPLGPLAVRIGIAALGVAYAARTDRAWLVPIAMVIAVPGLWPLSFALLAALPRLMDRGEGPLRHPREDPVGAG